jgi:hypothetical protein
MTSVLDYIELETPEFNDGAAGEKEVVGLEYDFTLNSIFSFTTSGCTFVAGTSGATLTTTGADQMLRTPAISIDGATERYIYLDVERTAVRTGGAWEGNIYYAIDGGHSESGSFFQDIPEIANTIGARIQVVLDMHSLAMGGTDWADNIITLVRFDFDNGHASGAFLVREIRIGSRDQTWRFTKPTEATPKDIDAIPSVRSIAFTPATVSLGENLGTRASLTVSFTDHKHIFGSEPFDQGTFFGKWRGRFGQRLRGRSVRWIRGVEGQSLEDMETWHFIVESVTGPTPDGVYQIVAQDILKLADDDRSLAPRPTRGILLGDIDDNDTGFTVGPSGIGDIDYPASGFVNIAGKEICAFTRSGDAFTITRNVTVPGTTFETEVSAHKAGARVQLCLSYIGEDPADIINDLFENYAGIHGDFIDTAAWQAETDTFLQTLYTTMITEPTGVKKLVTELVEQAGLAL